jgi:glutamine---fructose-6-phosphate transaminase (isomerizing)
MCGIVGYIGRDEAVTFLLPALKRLEYRGYDSAGIATVNGHGLEACRTAGKIANLESAVARSHPAGRLGIAHTRWATHGRPSEINAHPHVDCSGRIAVVHNGIIENHRSLRQTLVAEGHLFRSETDTEVFAHLIERGRVFGLPDAVRRAARMLQGSFALACIADDEPDMIVAVRGGGSPLVLGVGDDEAYLASDAPALLGKTSEVVVLGDGEMAILRRGSLTIRRLDGGVVHRAPTVISTDREAIEKGGYPHFMLKEIFEQPKAVEQTLLERIDVEADHVELPEIGLTDSELAHLSRVSFIGCGTSWHAGLVGKYLVEDLARMPAEAEIASEFRHRRPIFGADVLAVPISQSGETADTLAALRQARREAARAAAICNVVGSSVAREADGVLYTRAGLEIGVAATKTFTTQLAAVTLLALKLGKVRGTAHRTMIRNTIQALRDVPDLMTELLDQNDRIRSIAERLVTHTNCLYLGRGLQYPMALEGALKLKEISYVHAEGYPAGEMKHGPIALIEPQLPVVVLAAAGHTTDSMASNIQEVKARDGAIVALATRGDDVIGSLADMIVPIPPAPEYVQPLLLAIPLQLLAYHLGVLRGCDVDQPRNLAKSVTVE